MLMSKSRQTLRSAALTALTVAVVLVLFGAVRKLKPFQFLLSQSESTKQMNQVRSVWHWRFCSS